MSVSFPPGLSFAAGPGSRDGRFRNSEAEVRARKPNSLAERRGERELYRRPSRLLQICGAAVRARKPNSMALQGGERELYRRPSRLLLIFRAVVRA